MAFYIFFEHDIINELEDSGAFLPLSILILITRKTAARRILPRQAAVFLFISPNDPSNSLPALFYRSQ